MEKVGQAWHPAFDALGDGVCLLDSTGRIERVNEGLARLTGQAPEEMIGSPAGAVLGRGLVLLDLPALLPVNGDGNPRSAEVHAHGRRYALTFEPAGAGAGGVLVVRSVNGREGLDEARQQA